ncbi:MAG TPA: hypothetical protein VHC40_11335 [Rhizomicrobium sp.]|jgi:hypothetical protein|nr:hypothetical protein [Rhizomicrobium sp.]
MTTAPISLYLDLEPQTAPDIEVVAGASLAFAALIKELAYFVDPSLEIRIEFQSGTEGSLSLNSRIRELKRKATDPKTLAAIALAVVSYFSHEITDWTTERLFDHVMIRDDGHAELSQHDINEIAENVADLLKKKTALSQAQKVYQHLERDIAIKGVGVTQRSGERPTDIVPRAEFPARIAAPSPVEMQTRKRKTPFSGRLTLVSPVLLRADRRWKFIGPMGEFGAIIEDQAFVDRALSGHVRMAEGTQLNVNMETIEEFDGRVWHVKEYRILKVKSARRPPHQRSLPLLPDEDKTSRK